MRAQYAFYAKGGNIAAKIIDRKETFAESPHIARIDVVEGDDALKEMMTHFGDDSSWPPGWWPRVVLG